MRILLIGRIGALSKPVVVDEWGVWKRQRTGV